MDMGIKSALITGGNRGIGRACTLELARAGFDVAIGYNSGRRAALDVAGEVRRSGRTARVYRADLGKARDAAILMNRVIEDFGRLDVLVNNAAIAPVTDIDGITVAEWDRVMALNVRGAFICGQLALRQMRLQGGGRIVFISSQAGQTGGSFVGAHYSASKAALLGLTKSFARAGAGHGVLVNCVSPGQIDTHMTASFPQDKVQVLTRSIPLNRMGRPEEVAHVVAFLVSEGASYLTGAIVPVNGGLLMP
jgi:3-oxoacyl-[acyl-carrier protein] reductase